MSDTTTTITPEERASWRDECKNWMGRDSEIVIRMRLLSALETAQAENARLRAERDWLAERCAEHCEDKRPNPSCSVAVCTITHCSKATTEEWKETAFRAVGGEG